MTSKSKKKAPITSHPAFPVVVALWFAALFGMGSLLVHPGVLESLVAAIRLDRLVPAAAPPLGFTARTLVAILLAGTGGLVGFGLGRALGGGAGPRRDASLQPVQRGRAADAVAATTSAAVETAPADDNDDLARLEAARESNPARRRGVNAQLVVDPFAAPPPLTMAEPAILNLGDLTAIDPIGLVTETPPLPVEPEAEAVPLVPAAAPEPAPAPAPAAPVFRPRQGSAAEMLRQAPLDTLGVVELVERFAMALAERRARAAAAPVAASALPVEAPVLRDEPVVVAANDAIDLQVDGQPANGAGANGQPHPFDRPPALAGDPEEWLNGAHHALPVQALPEDEPSAGHLRSLEEGGWALPELDDEPESAEAMDADLAAAAELEAAAAPAEPEEQAFSSLLAMKPAARQAAVAPHLANRLIDSGDAIVRPPVASAETTEEALRKALATLQRMSGAA